MTAKTSSALIFPACVGVAVVLGMLQPALFSHYFGYDLKLLIVPLIQIIMFGMGAKLSANDFIRVFVMPWPVFIGVALHYTVMPLLGFGIANLFGFPPEIAAGVILVGSVSSGAASNLIAYLSGANVALAVTVTACSTLVSPFMTPFLMKILAGRLIEIDFMKMFLEILNMVLVPVIAGLLANRILYGKERDFNRPAYLSSFGVAALAGGAAIAMSRAKFLGPLHTGGALGLILIGVVCFAKLFVNVLRHRDTNWMDRVLPIVSMTGICVIIGIITSRSRNQLINVGLALIAAAILHNAIGYLLGYWLARAVRLDKTTSRTIAIEVGMQNAGMASGLAMGVLQSAEAALAPALFGPWMNISGAILAAFWRRNPVTTDSTSKNYPA
ncbi:MAG TPA: bile acid:sodium symporter family protein [Verrucomicrobiae bacterium]|jgi:BASS family bile acid:Na+ symporter